MCKAKAILHSRCTEEKGEEREQGHVRIKIHGSVHEDWGNISGNLPYANAVPQKDVAGESAVTAHVRVRHSVTWLIWCGVTCTVGG